MPITRAQYLAGDQGQGPVLSGEVQAVKEGYGIDIATDGTISVDTSQIAPTRLLPLTVSPAFDGATQVFTLIDPATSNPVAPTPSDNIMVFVGGVIQLPVSSFVIAGTGITFTDPPPLGTTFIAFTTAYP